MTTYSADQIRNIAIIAHVDHGKTTLVDELLKQSGTFRENEQVSERMMDSMDLERERGITISAKNTAVIYKNHKINIVDTPGHADFGGEVERILSMVDGACLLVDAAEGPLPQTRFVLKKALEQGLKVFVVINKVDRKDARAAEVLDEIFGLFVDLEASDEQCDFPCLYAVARDGKAFKNLADWETTNDLSALFDTILEVVPPPPPPKSDKVQMLIASLSYSEYLGRMAVGRVRSGTLRVGMRAARIEVDEDGNPVEKPMRVQALFTYEGLAQIKADEVGCGDIAVLAGMDDFMLGDSIVEVPDAKVAPEDRWSPIDLALPRLKIDEPTLEIEWHVNNSPMAGLEGKHVTSRKLRDRLVKETLTNVALRFRETDSPDRFTLAGRGELQMAILAEQLRREGFEFSLSQPQILYKEINGEKHEPMELAVLDIPEFSQGTITQIFQQRKGLLQNIENRGNGRVRLEILIPARGLIGLRSRFLTETKGEGLLNTISAEYEPFKGDLPQRSVGALVADRAGESNAYALETLQERGVLFIGIQTKVYEGMIIGENARAGDLNVNPCKAKQLTNFRTVNKDDAITLTPPKLVSIETGLEWLNEDELLEVTPTNIRARKKQLTKHQRGG
ncbi:translational GTPase TypA [bacterium]|nr:translational GTPase TypA [bacterium]